MSKALNQGDIYSSPPNRILIERTTGFKVHNFLDVGAGTGNNLKAFQRIHPCAFTAAITCSEQESLELKKLTKETFIFDLNNINNEKERQKSGLEDLKYDLILLSHVLEHTQDPLNVLNGICNLLSPNGKILIALPNICHWRTRMQIARGRFHYQNDGILDRTHLRFFSYWSAIELVNECTELTLLDNWAVGGTILGPIRRLLPNQMCKWLDNQATNRRPNLFGYEIHLLAHKRDNHN